MLTAATASCLLPSPERIETLNAADRDAVQGAASSKWDCERASISVRGSPNALGRMTTWYAEGCGHQAKYSTGGKAGDEGLVEIPWTTPPWRKRRTEPEATSDATPSETPGGEP